MKKNKHILSPKPWSWLRIHRILLTHKRVTGICEKLIADYFSSDANKPAIKPLKDLEGRKIIWQYWGQGYDNVPPIVRECLDSVEEHRGGYDIIRLTDETVGEYISIPKEIVTRCKNSSFAQYSDLLRLALLATYGGLWLDSTILMTGRFPQEYESGDFFVYQRDASEPHKEYWENVYAYYYGWHKGFRVNMLSSVFFAKKGSTVVNDLYGLMLHYWSSNTSLPDYFFLQILFDVLINGRRKGLNCPVVSDCRPHFLQQLRGDPAFSLATEEEILRSVPLHKMTYK